VKGREERKAEQGAVVVVINKRAFIKRFFKLLIVVNFLSVSSYGLSATLPPDSVDAVYHGYDGGGLEVDGPFLLVRKSVGNQVSLNGHYYVDSISSASIDVVTTASKYTEERTEYSAGVDFLNEKTMISAGFTNSEENDFSANSVFFSMSQDFFGDLSKFSMAYGRGWDEVGMIENDFKEEADRQSYKLGFSQIITKNSLMGIDFEGITDEGYLNNPYRQYRYTDPNDGTKFLMSQEIYPETRTSSAVAIRGLYYLPYRASVKGEYRYFQDSWGIRANTFELLYVHPIGSHWTLEGRYRQYDQTKADFYQDLFTHEGAEDFMARDKELSTFSTTTWGGGVTYELGQGAIPHVDRLKMTLLMDYLTFDYDNFRDLRETTATPGNEPLYGFNAWVTRLSITLEY